ncbi:MAG: hypothetical protein HYV07_24015 [Deltaproteobacteria bacterium]|nr:hypothetical protein [Deltaproteobacteria bacterium]
MGRLEPLIRRKADRLLLSIEHRAAPSVGGISIELGGGPDALALSVVNSGNDREPNETPATPATDRVIEVLATAGEPLGLTALRKLCRMRTQTLAAALETLVQNGRVTKTPGGYELTSPVPVHALPI